MSATTPIHLERPDGKGLATGSLGLWGSTVIGLASTAPVYSLVATLGFVVLAVGAQAPIAFIIAFVPMLLIAFAYRELNNAVPDCGTTFTWGTKAFGPWVGWMGGWGVAVAGMVVLANLAQIASVYFWSLIGFDLENNDWRIILVAVLFIASMTWVSWRGVEIGERILHADYESMEPTPKALCPRCDFLPLCQKHPDFAEGVKPWLAQASPAP